jgi:hypothetical protein
MDHKSLIYILNQKNLSGRQAHWIEKIGKLDFTVEYVPGAHNILPDALSRMYDFDAAGTVRAVSEYIVHDEDSPPSDISGLVSMPVLVGDEAWVMAPQRSAQMAARATGGQPMPKTTPTAPPAAWKAARRDQEDPAWDALEIVADTLDKPLVTSVKGIPATCNKPKVPVALAETGRPETSGKFA